MTTTSNKQREAMDHDNTIYLLQLIITLTSKDDAREAFGISGDAGLWSRVSAEK
jgi:beta-lactamase class A